MIQIMSYMYPLDVDGLIKPDIEYFNYYKNHKIIEKQCMDILNLSTVCKYFNNIVKENGMKVIYFKGDIKIEIIKKYKSEYVIAPKDCKLNNNDMEHLTNLSYLDLIYNKNITDAGIKILNNLSH